MASFRILCVALGLLIVPASVGQIEQSPAPGGLEPIGIEIKLTDKMIYNWLDVVADDMALDYELNDDQYYQVNEILYEHIPTFLRDNRDDIQKVVTEFAEVFGDNEAPDSITVAEWAERARPLLDKFRGSVETMSDDFRDVFDEGQIVKLDGYLAMMDAGTSMVEQRLHAWEEGTFDPSTDWWRGTDFRAAERERRVDMERRMVEAKQDAIAFHLGEDWEDAPPPPGAGREIAPPPGKRDAARSGRSAGRGEAESRDPWKLYTERFIAHYELNDSQTQQARMLYERAARDRDLYERRRLSDLNRIAALAEKATTEEDRENVRQAKARYQKGIDQMFKRFKEKLDRVATRKQKAVSGEFSEQARVNEKND